jgi:hypothetical protein
MSSPRQSLEIPSEEIQVVSEEKNTSTELNKHINSPDNNSHENTERITEEVGEFVVLQMPPQKGSKNSLRSSFTIEDSISPKKKRGSSNFSKGSWSHLVKPNDSTKRTKGARR